MMLLLLSCLLATTAAFPQGEPHQDEVPELEEIQEILVPLETIATPKLYKDPIPIISMESEVSHDGNFHYSYESADGSKAQQVGELRDFGEKKGSVSTGSYEYIGDDGITYRVSYIADENGFQATGDHLPVAPPVPEAIARALAYIAAHPPAPEKQDAFPVKVIAN